MLENNKVCSQLINLENVRIYLQKKKLFFIFITEVSYLQYK